MITIMNYFCSTNCVWIRTVSIKCICLGCDLDSDSLGFSPDGSFLALYTYNSRARGNKTTLLKSLQLNKVL